MIIMPAQFKQNRAASRALDILKLISENDESLTITKISQALDIPKSTTYELLYTLLEKRFLEMDNEKLKTFRLGLETFKIGSAFLNKADIYHESRSWLEKLMQACGETVFLAVQDSGELVYINKVEGNSLVRTTAILGSRKPMHCTGLGKALLAAYPCESVKNIVGEGALLTITKHTIKNYDDLMLDLEQIRKRGYSIDAMESQLDVSCVAVPVYDGESRPIAAISIASLSSRMNEDRITYLSNLVVDAALNISRRLGFSEGKLYF